MRKNEFRYYAENLFYGMSQMIITGAYLQTFMLECGINEQSVQYFVSVMQIVQVAVMLLCSKKIEQIKNLIPYSATIRFLFVPMFIAMVFCGVNTSMSTDLKYIILFASSVFANIVLGFNLVVAYKLPYQTLDINRYGISSSIATGSGAAGTFFLSLMVSWLLTGGEYFSVMTIIILIGLVFTVLSGFITLKYEKVDVYSSESRETKKINIFKYKPFYYLVIPNLLRGFCAGIFNIAVSIGYHFELIDKITAGYLVIIMTVATIATSFLYTYISTKNIDGPLLVVSSIVVAVSLPMMLVNNNPAMFLVFYLIGYLALNLINNAVPVAITKFVEYDVIGQYSAYRMLLHTLGIALSGFFCMAFFEFCGGILSMLIFGLMQLVSGCAYYICIKNFRVLNNAE